MKKNERFIPAIPKTRNELADALEQKEHVIYIEGQIFEDLKEQTELDLEKRKKAKRWFGGGMAAGLFFWLIPGIGWTILGLISCSLLTCFGNNEMAARELKEYKMGFYESKGELQKIILVRNDYSFKHDSVEDDIILSDKKSTCSKCGRKLQDNYCPDCEKQIVVVKEYKKKLKIKQ